MREEIYLKFIQYHAMTWFKHSLTDWWFGFSITNPTLRFQSIKNKELLFNSQH